MNKMWIVVIILSMLLLTSLTDTASAQSPNAVRLIVIGTKNGYNKYVYFNQTIRKSEPYKIDFEVSDNMGLYHSVAVTVIYDPNHSPDVEVWYHTKNGEIWYRSDLKNCINHNWLCNCLDKIDHIYLKVGPGQTQNYQGEYWGLDTCTGNIFDVLEVYVKTPTTTASFPPSSSKRDSAPLPLGVYAVTLALLAGLGLLKKKKN